MLLLLFANVLQAQILNIPQPLKQWLLTSYYAGSYSYPQNSYDAIDANHDGEIQTSEADLVQSVLVPAGITSLSGLEQFVNLKQLICSGEINSFDGVFFPNLRSFQLNYSYNTGAHNPPITSIDFSGMVNLEYVSIHSARLLQSLNFNGLPNLKTIKLDQNSGPSSINLNAVPSLTDLSVNSSNQLQSINLSQATALKNLLLTLTQITTLDLTGLTNLEKCHIYENAISTFTHGTLPNLKELWCYKNALNSLDLTGMPSIESVICLQNNITRFYWESQPYQSLLRFDCSQNLLTTLHMDGFSNLRTLNCSSNHIYELSVNGATNLIDLVCSYNGQLETLDLSGFPHLRTLNCSGNLIASLDINDLPELAVLNCSSNRLTAFPITTEMRNLFEINCSNNQLLTLDIQKARATRFLDCSYNPLSSLYIKNNTVEGTLRFSNNPNLHYICSDTNQLTQVQNLVNTYGYTNCTLVDDCFTLSNTDFNTADSIVVYPNPVSDVLKMETPAGIGILSVTIFNTLAQEVLSVLHTEGIHSLDVSGLKSGAYFIRVETDKGTITKRFVKE